MQGCLNTVDNTGFTPENPSIAFSESPVQVSNAGGEVEVGITSNLPWRAVSDAPWATISVSHAASSARITVTVQKNRTREAREAHITAWITRESKTVLTLNQEGADASESFVYYVKTSGDGLASGLSWAEATTLPSALELAAEGDVICVAAGSYSPVALITGGELEEEKTFEIPGNITIEGGYPADAADGAVCDPVANETVLSGGGKCFHTVVVSAPKSASAKVVLKGLTSTGGEGYSATETYRRSVGGVLVDAAYGGGLVIAGSNFEVVDCRIAENTSTHAAGCLVMPRSEGSFTRCTIFRNTANVNGGGLWNQGGSIVMRDCVISSNISGQQAAGFYSIDSGGAPSVSRVYNCTFQGNDNTLTNTKRSGGATYIRAGSDAVFVNCTFTQNKAGYGGVISGHGTTALPSKAAFISCTMTGNLANDGGGALFAYNANATITAYNCIISGNTGPSGSENAGVLDGVGAEHVMVLSSILGSSLVDKGGLPVPGWSFNAETMLGAYGTVPGGITPCFPLVESADNPAVAGGLDAAGLADVAGSFVPPVDGALLSSDQNGSARTGKSIGSVTSSKQ